MSDLCVLVPTRGRPHNAERLLHMWNDTVDTAVSTELLFLVDGDDPTLQGYLALSVPHIVIPRWMPMVPKLNAAAVKQADRHFALGFMGDDHLPRTPGWNVHVVRQLRKRGTGIVYADDLYQRARLPTQWFMTSDIVQTLRRMVPAPVDHLYCDNAILLLGRGARCIDYLSDVVIEHMHPGTGKAENDAGYQRVNSRQQYRRDRVVFDKWRRGNYARDLAALQRLTRRNHAT